MPAILSLCIEGAKSSVKDEVIASNKDLSLTKLTYASTANLVVDKIPSVDFTYSRSSPNPSVNLYHLVLVLNVF